MKTVPKFFLCSAVARGVLVLLQLATCRVASAAPPVPNTSKSELKRYLVFTDAAASEAAARGARIVRQTRGLKAVVCPPALAQALGLAEDIPVQAADNTANDQVQATPVQELGLTGKGRRIVVLDTGYNYNHPELASSYLGGTNFIRPDRDAFDDNGHGSHVAGIITGDGINPRAKGIAPDTGIIAGKVLDTYGNGYISDVVAGIYWAVDGPDGYFGTADDFQADAINISISSQGTYSYSSVFCDAAVPSLTDAIKYALDHGVAVVMAAGNNGVAGVSAPGCVSYGITVGAITHSNVLASFSGTGPAIDLVSPGVALYSASLGTNYKSMDGTSQATPVVSGTIALLKEAFPNASVNDLEQALLMTAADLGVLGKDNRYGWGRLDASQALRSLIGRLANPSMTLIRSNAQLIISWPAIPPGFVLQVNSDVTALEGWASVTNSIVAIGDQKTVILSISATRQFYRLQWP